MGPVPSREQPQSLMRRAANATIGLVARASQDEEVRTGALRWAARRLLG